ncbi:MAG: MBL fold metallo-hydrolase [Chthoniobacterales bacterium]
MLEIVVLGSGSSGNAILVRDSREAILIDVGFSAKQITRRLSEAGTSWENISAILLTHEHSDHTRGLRVLCSQREIPVYANPLTAEAIRFQQPELKAAWCYFSTGSDFKIGGYSIESFSVSHDASDPVGFTIRHAKGSIGIATDLGFPTRVVAERLRDVNTLFLESNYDEKLLEQDERRPWSTKQRISSRHGHLSNRSAAALVADIMHPQLSTIILGHFSKDCNCTDVATQTFREVFSERNLQLPRIVCASQDCPTPVIEVTAQLEIQPRLL